MESEMDRQQTIEEMTNLIHRRLELVAAPIMAALVTDHSKSLSSKDCAKQAVDLAIELSDEARRRALELAKQDLAASTATR
jgi:hypothetical protein